MLFSIVEEYQIKQIIHEQIIHEQTIHEQIIHEQIHNKRRSMKLYLPDPRFQVNRSIKQMEREEFSLYYTEPEKLLLDHCIPKFMKNSVPLTLQKASA